MSEIERLRALLAELTEECAPGPWHGVESGDRAAYSWWLENQNEDSSFPDPDDVAAILNALPALLDVAEAARAFELADRRRHVFGGTPNLRKMLPARDALHAALARLDGAS